MEQEILNEIAKKEGYSNWYELTEQNDPNTIHECTIKAIKQALSIANVVGRSEQLKAFLQEIENDKTYILNDYYKNKAKRLRESL